MRNTKWLKNGKFRQAILSAFYNISQRNIGILPILWCSFKLWWNFCIDQNFSYKGKGPLFLKIVVAAMLAVLTYKSQFQPTRSFSTVISGSELSLQNSFAFFLEKFHVKIHILGLPPDFFEHHKKPKRNAAHAMILLRHFEHDCNHFILDKALHSAKNQTLP